MSSSAYEDENGRVLNPDNIVQEINKLDVSKDIRDICVSGNDLRTQSMKKAELDSRKKATGDTIKVLTGKTTLASSTQNPEQPLNKVVPSARSRAV